MERLPSDSHHVVDPLAVQMDGLLRLSNRPTPPVQQQRQARRFSDADLDSVTGDGTKPHPASVRSRDGTRWLPAPDSQTRIIGKRQSGAGEGEEAVSAQPLKQHVCDAAICAVTRVFATTELLELILSLLETRDVLNLRLTSPKWNATVQASPHLRLHLFYYPQFVRPATDYRLLPLSLPGLSIEAGEPLHLGQWILVSFTPEAARKISSEPIPHHRVRRSRSIFEGLRGGLGSSRAGRSTDPWPARRATNMTTLNLQYENLFVTQPPLSSMQAFIISSTPPSSGADSHDDDGDDDDIGSGEPAACAKLSCDAGVTLGFLAETAQSLLATSEESSSSAIAAEKNDRIVLFKAIMSFTETQQAPRKRGNARSVTRIG